jgi:hypothetical protein
LIVSICLALAIAVTGALAQEASCVDALEARAKAGEAVMASLPRLDAGCSQLKAQLDAFSAAEAAYKKSHALVRRSCPPGEFVRAKSDPTARSQFILEAARRSMAKCPGAASE